MKASPRVLSGFVICVVLVASFLLLVEPSLGIFPSAEVSFETVDPGGGYGYEDRDNFAIRDAQTWEDLWLELYSGHFPVPDVPTVDFSSEMLIAVFQGECSSSGYFTYITRITRTITYYSVYVDEIHPGENCGVLTVMTYPYHIVKISDPLYLQIRFIYNITDWNCE
ncbi:MAG: protease complex subunit PrcB family protein [Candidatus Thorarchaeota archaeon]